MFSIKGSNILMYQIFLCGLLALYLVQTNQTNAAGADFAEIVEAISNGQNSKILDEVRKNPELVFTKPNGETLLISAARFGNHVAAIELIEAGADWLEQTGDSLPFCQLLSQRIIKARALLVGQAILRRLESEDKLLNSGKPEELIQARIAARQVPFYLSQTKTECSPILDESYANYGDRESYLDEGRLLMQVLLSKNAEKVDETFQSLLQYSLVSMPDKKTWSSHCDKNSFCEIVKTLVDNRAAGSLRMVIESLDTYELLEPVFANVSNSIDFLIETISGFPNATAIMASPYFANRIAKEIETSDNQSILDNLYNHGLESALQPTDDLLDVAVEIFVKNGDKRLLSTVVQNRLPLRNQPKSLCCIDNKYFNKELENYLRYQDFANFHKARVKLNYTLEELVPFLNIFVESGEVTKEEIQILISDAEGMSIYSVVRGGVENWISGFIKSQSLENAENHLLLLKHLEARGHFCKKGDSYYNRCSVFGSYPSWEAREAVAKFGPKIPFRIWLGWARIGSNVSGENSLIGFNLLIQVVQKYLSSNNINVDDLIEFIKIAAEKNESIKSKVSEIKDVIIKKISTGNYEENLKNSLLRAVSNL